ncbi:MAG: AAA family ATPase, partial [Kiritimatiellae bacterium]|nr:AAA family ATPase [Kiritimatiellia bacterium]
VCVIMAIVMVVIGFFLPDKKKDDPGAEKPKVQQSTTENGTKSQASPADAPYDAEAELAKALAELDELVGLEGVKAEVKTIVNKEKVAAAQRAMGMPVPSRSLHMVFTGNPGTGKTTVARLIARIFRALGIVKSDNFVEVDRSGLVGRYMGETAIKTNAKIDEAVGIPVKHDSSGKECDMTVAERRAASEKAPGGILFVDEAYQLYSSDSDDYGKEAIATLLKRMEDERGKLIVIAAGYTDEMRDFLGANSGLSSRFNLEIGAELVGHRPTPGVHLPSNVIGDEMRGGQIVRFGMVAGIAGHDVLVVRKATDGAFVVRKRLKAHVLDDLQLLRRVNPDSAVPRFPIDVAGNFLDLLVRDGAGGGQGTGRPTGGDPPVDEYMIRVDGALDAHESLAVPPDGEIDDGFHNGVRQAVGMPRGDVFSNV